MKKTELEVSNKKVSVPRKLTWGGVMPKVGANEKNEIELQKFCNLVSQVYGVPSTGVNAMGGQPYLNKNGRLFLLGDIKKGKIGLKKTKKEFIQMSTGADVPAIVKVTLIFKDGLEVEAIGEASKQSVKLEAVKATLNMMAETRAMNRAIWEAVSYETMVRIAERLEAMKIPENQKAKIINAGATTYEEMQRPDERVEATVNTPTKTPVDKIIKMTVTAIREAKDVETLIKIDERAKVSKAISQEDKEMIHSLISAKVTELEN